MNLLLRTHNRLIFPMITIQLVPIACFTVPDNWSGMDVFIHFGAVKSAFYIWVNGQKVGYSEDSKTPAEFKITSYLRPGQNLVALQVYRWSDGSYLEVRICGGKFQA